jgi:hypothetical protein
MLYWIAIVLAPVLILISSFITFVTYNEYPLLAPEILICGSVILILGIALSLLGRLSRLLAAAILSIFLLLFADIQFEPPLLLLVLAAAPLLALFWVLGDNLALICSVVFATIAASTPLRSGTQAPLSSATIAEKPSSSDLPVFLHIILDEHIGVEGLPDEAEGASVLREELKVFYIGNDFRLFGQAYSRFVNTYLSVSHLMNDALTFETGLVVVPKSDRFAYRMTRNRHLAQAQKTGYRLTVYQPNYVDFCTTLSGDVAVDRCHTYPVASIGSIRDTALPVAAKVRVIASMYLNSSRIYKKLRNHYDWLVRYKLGLPLPAWTWDRNQVGPIPVMMALDRIEADLARARPGDFFLAHLLIPHFPYVYDSGCNLRTNPEEWLNKDTLIDRFSKWAVPNTAVSRMERYHNYLAQIACTNRRLERLFAILKGSGQFERAIILIHGDHGSRITRSPLYAYAHDRLTPDDYQDGFSTLFALKAPGIEPGYDRDPWPIGRLLKGLRQVEFHTSPIFDAAQRPATVYLLDPEAEQHIVETIMPGLNQNQDPDAVREKTERLAPAAVVRQVTSGHHNP